jgi:hypothetical protein
MSTTAVFATPLGRRRPTAHRRPTAMPVSPLPLPERLWEHLVVLGPLCLVPLAGSPADSLLLTLVFALLVGADIALASASLLARQWTLAAMLGAALWLATAPVLGTGAMVTFGLFLVVRCIERQVPETNWPARLGLGALATALIVDLSLVTLALERSVVWLALGAAIGTAFAANRMLLTPGNALQGATVNFDAATADRRHVWLEAVLMTALVLVLAFYGALLASEPALVAPAVAGGYLTVPIIALAVLRLAMLTLTGGRRRGVDPLAALLLAGWALTAANLFGHA